MLYVLLFIADHVVFVNRWLIMLSTKQNILKQNGSSCLSESTHRSVVEQSNKTGLPENKAKSLSFSERDGSSGKASLSQSIEFLMNRKLSFSSSIPKSFLEPRSQETRASTTLESTLVDKILRNSISAGLPPKPPPKSSLLMSDS